MPPQLKDHRNRRQKRLHLITDTQPSSHQQSEDGGHTRTHARIHTHTHARGLSRLTTLHRNQHKQKASVPSCLYHHYADLENPFKTEL